MADQSGREIRLAVRTLEHGQFSYTFPTTATVADLKHRLEASTGIPVSRHRVLLRGRELAVDDVSLTSLNLPDNAVLHLATRPPPETAHRGPGGPAPAPGPQGPQGFPQGFPGPGGAFNPMDLMSMLQNIGFPVAGGPGGVGGGPGGATGIAGTISIGPGGVATAGPFGGNMGLTPEEAAEIEESVERVMSGNPIHMTHRAGGVPITISLGVPGATAPHGHQGPRNPAQPRLDPHGRYRGRSLLQGIDEMLVRLQNGNMQEDPSPAVAFTPADVVRRPGEAPAWAAAAAAFLAAARPVLRGAALSRETLAAVNRVFEAAGLAPLPLGVQSFPLEGLNHSGDDGEAAGGGARGGGDASEGPPSLVSDYELATSVIMSEEYGSYDSEEDPEYDPEDDGYGFDDEMYDSEEEDTDLEEWDSQEEEDEEDDAWETDPGEEEEGEGRVGAAAAGGEESDDELPALCSDSSDGESERSLPHAHRHASGPPPLVSDDDEGLPPLLSDSDSDDGAAARARGRGRPAAGPTRGAAPPAPAATWLRSVSDDDLILVAAVTVGELTRRFMAVIGQETAPVGVNALAVRLAARLRSLSSLDGASRREILRQTRLVAGHLQRVAASAAELGRAMQYLDGALGDAPNMQFLATQPLFVGWHSGRPVAALASGFVASGGGGGGVAGGWGAAPPPGAATAVRMEVRRAPAPPPPDRAAAAPPPAPPPAPAPAQTPAAAQVASIVQSIAERPGVPPGIASLLSALSNNISTGGVEALSSGNIVNELSSGLAALNRLLVTSVDIRGIGRDVQQAVATSLAASGSGGGGGAASPAAAASAAASAVEGALRRHMRGLGQDAEARERLGQLGGLLGVDLVGTLRTLGGDEPSAAGAGPPETGGTAAAAAPPAPAPAAPVPAARAAPAPPQPAASAAAAPTRAPAPAAAPAAPRPGPAGLGRGLQPRGVGGGGGPSLPPRPGSGGPSLPPRRPAAQPSAAPASSSRPTGATPATSAGANTGGAPAGGSGAGLSSLLSSVMSNPAMQQAAGQLLGGAPSASGRSTGGAAAPAGGLDIGALMNAAGPMLGQLMGGAGAGGPPGRTPSGRARPTAQQPQPADLESALAAAGLPADEAARWKATIEADEAAQAAMAPQDTFSDAYLAAMPPRAASGLLAGLLGDD